MNGPIPTPASQERVLFFCPLLLDVLPYVQGLLDDGHAVELQQSYTLDGILSQVLTFQPTAFFSYNATSHFVVKLSILLEIPLYYHQADNPQQTKWKPYYDYSLQSGWCFTPEFLPGQSVDFSPRNRQLYDELRAHFSKPENQGPFYGVQRIFTQLAVPRDLDIIHIGNTVPKTEDDLKHFLNAHAILPPEQEETILSFCRQVVENYRLVQWDVVETLKHLSPVFHNSDVLSGYISILQILRRVVFLRRLGAMHPRHVIRIYGNEEIRTLVPADRYGGFIESSDMSAVLSRARIVVTMSSNLLFHLPRSIEYVFCGPLIMSSYHDMEKCSRYLGNDTYGGWLHEAEYLSLIEPFTSFENFEQAAERLLADEPERARRANVIKRFVDQKLSQKLHGKQMLFTLKRIKERYAASKVSWDAKHKTLLAHDHEALLLAETAHAMLQERPPHPMQEQILRWTQALHAAFWGELSREAPNREQLLRERVAYCLKKKNYEGAKPWLELLEKGTTKTALLWAEYFRETGNFGQAESTLQHAWAADSSDPKVGHVYAKLLLNSGKWTEALPLLTELQRRDHYLPLIDLDIGLCLRALGRHAEAYQAFQAAHKYNKYNYAIYYNLALLEAERGDFQQAKDHCEQAQEQLKSVQGNPILILLLQGVVLLCTGNGSAVEGIVRELRTHSPFHADAMAFLFYGICKPQGVLDLLHRSFLGKLDLAATLVGLPFVSIDLARRVFDHAEREARRQAAHPLLQYLLEARTKLGI